MSLEISVHISIWKETTKILSKKKNVRLNYFVFSFISKSETTCGSDILVEGSLIEHQTIECADY